MDLSEKSYIDKVVGHYNIDNPVNGKLLSLRFRNVNSQGDIVFIGRERLKGTDASGNPVFQRINDDIQFAGRCYQGDGVASIDVSSFVTGTLTANVTFYNDGTGWVGDHSLTTEINDTAKTITLQDNHKASHIKIFEDSVLVAEYSGCEQSENGALLSNILENNGRNASITNGTLSDFFTEDSTVPFSWLNERGYTIGSGGEVIQAIRSDYQLGTDGNSLDYQGKLAPRIDLINSEVDAQFPDIPSLDESLRGQTVKVDDLRDFYTKYRTKPTKRGELIISSEELLIIELQRDGFPLGNYLDNEIGSEIGFVGGFRKRIKSYNGPAIELRRDGTADTMDVYFTDNDFIELNDPVLLAWVSGHDIIVSRIYNQLPIVNQLFDSVDEATIDTDMGGYIYSNGEWNMLTGENVPTLVFDNTSNAQYMAGRINPTIGQQNIYSGFVAEVGVGGDYYQSFAREGGSTQMYQRHYIRDTISGFNHRGPGSILSGGVTASQANTPLLSTYQEDTTSRVLKINEVSVKTNSTTANYNDTSVKFFYLGKQDAAGNGVTSNNCSVSEVFLFLTPENLDTDRIEMIMNFPYVFS